MVSVVLALVIVYLEKTMDISIAQTASAFLDCRDKMEYLTHQVHEHILTSGFMKTKRNALVKAIAKIADSNDRLLVTSFIGKLRHKLPEVKLPNTPLHAFDKERAQIIAAAVITQILIDGGTYEVTTETEVFEVHGDKKFRRLLYLELGGKPENDYYRGIELEPGVVNQKTLAGWKLSADEKSFLAMTASVPFKIADICTEELLWKGYTLKEDWLLTRDKNGKKLPEDPICKRNRYRTYADKIVNHVKKFPKFYLTMKYCTRGRVYYENGKLEGMRPHGKLWETLMIDAAEPYYITERDLDVLKHIIYVTLYGRVSMKKAVKTFGASTLKKALKADPMKAETEDEFGNAILLNKAAAAIMSYEQGTPITFLFGYDFTNSGLLLAGVSFRSKEMMHASNVYGGSEVVDSHTTFGEAYELPLERKSVKKIHTALLHGGTNRTLLKELHAALGEDALTLEDVGVNNVKAYGPAVNNIAAIADWGSQVVGNQQSVLRWTLPDGFRSSARAYLQGVPVSVYVASASHKERYTHHVVVSDMPLLEDSQGFPVYDKDTELGGVSYPVEVKKRGLYAGITHGLDAYALRHITQGLIEAGYPVLLKHDNYAVPPGGHQIVMSAAKEVFEDLFNMDMYQEAVNEIAEHSPYSVEAPQMIHGNAHNMVWQSSNFLMP